MTGIWMRRWMAPLAMMLGMAALPAPAGAQGDLLVAPTRVVLDGRRSAEVVLNNIGSNVATYRISLEIKRMNSDGRLEPVDPAVATAMERAMSDMLVFSPRRVTLPPNQPQVIRISARPPEGLPDGEYRAHMLFRAVPEARPVTEAVDAGGGVAIALTPIYGVTIPVIVRRGNLSATGSLADARLERVEDDRTALRLTINRQGSRSLYGEIIVTRVGAAEPALVARGVGVYTEVNQRHLTLPLTPEQTTALRGARVNIRYVEDRDVGSAPIAELTNVQL